MAQVSPRSRGHWERLMQNEDVAGRAGIDPLDKGEAALWRAVIAWAIEDACGNGHGLGGMYRARAMDAARSWFEGAGRDFRLVCDLAGLDAQAVRAGATAKIESAARPRAPRSCDASYATVEALPSPLTCPLPRPSSRPKSTSALPPKADTCLSP